jgi:hypothetical protein
VLTSNVTKQIQFQWFCVFLFSEYQIMEYVEKPSSPDCNSVIKNLKLFLKFSQLF